MAIATWNEKGLRSLSEQISEMDGIQKLDILMSCLLGNTQFVKGQTISDASVSVYKSFHTHKNFWSLLEEIKKMNGYDNFKTLADMQMAKQVNIIPVDTLNLFFEIIDS